MARILLVDDDEDFLTLLRQYLNSRGFEADVANGSARARHFLAHSEYDAVVSDFNMPGESGLDLLAHVSCRFHGLPFILITGNHSARLKQEAVGMGCAGYLEKPFQLQELFESIRAILAPEAKVAGMLDKTG